MSRAKPKPKPTHAPINPQPRSIAAPRRWLPFAIAVVVGLVVAVAALGIRHGPDMTPAAVAGEKEQPLGEPQINDAKPPGAAPEGMVRIPGGTFWMGMEVE